MTMMTNPYHRRWSSESAYFQGVFTLDHLDHLLIKRNRNIDTSRNTQNSFFTNAGLGGLRGPEWVGARSTSNRGTSILLQERSL